MTDTSSIVPATALAEIGINPTQMAPGLAIMFYEPLYQRCTEIAHIMAESKGMVPPHLIGKKYACFAVVTRAITWRLDPFAVAASTYEVGGKVAYEGKLVQAILESSGRLEGGIQFEDIELDGNTWAALGGKFKMSQGDKGKQRPVKDWGPDDEKGLGVRVSGKVRDEVHPRQIDVMLWQCYPRNSTLWDVNPWQQIRYRAVRVFASVAAPSLLMGVPGIDPQDTMRDITPSGEFGNSEPFVPQAAQTIEAPDDDDHLREQGRLARRSGVGYRQVPGHLPPMAAELWREGWQAEDRDHHGADTDDGRPEPEETGSDDDEGKDEGAGDMSPAEAAYADGRAAQAAGKGLMAIPAGYKTDKELTDAFQKGWRDEEKAAKAEGR